MGEKNQDSDIDRLAGKLGMDNLYYQNIREHEDQLERLIRWPLYREILDLIGYQGSSSQNNIAII